VRPAETVCTRKHGLVLMSRIGYRQALAAGCPATLKHIDGAFHASTEAMLAEPLPLIECAIYVHESSFSYVLEYCT
jgi:hypothetical protein